MTLEDLCLWPDGTHCFVEDLEDYLNPPCTMSDDFEIIPIDTPRWFSAQGLNENGYEWEHTDIKEAYRD